MHVQHLNLFGVILLVQSERTHGLAAIPLMHRIAQRCDRANFVTCSLSRYGTVIFNSNVEDGSEDGTTRTTFDEAGKSLIAEEDNKRMEAMGDYDLNPDVSISVSPVEFWKKSKILITVVHHH
jgi:hypothetical protein